MVRLKHRYLLLQILYPDGPSTLPGSLSFNGPTNDALTPRNLSNLIRENIADLFGDYGSGLTAASLQVKYLSTPTSTAIVRVTRAHYRLAWAACTAITHVPDGGRTKRECVVKVVRVSGTIRKAELEAVRRAKEAIEGAKRNGIERPLTSSGAGNATGIVSDDDGSDSDQG